MTGPLDPAGRRARILRATRHGATLSVVCRRVLPARIVAKKDISLQRLKTAAALRQMKADGLLMKTRDGWTPTPAGAAELDRMERERHVQS